MPYVNGDGTVNQTRSPFRISIITDLLWTVVNTIGLFISTLINPSAALPSSRDASRYNRLHNTSLGSSNTRGSGGGGGGGSRPTNRNFGARVAQLPKPSCNTGK
eukprot:gene9732-10572_t